VLALAAGFFLFVCFRLNPIDPHAAATLWQRGGFAAIIALAGLAVGPLFRDAVARSKGLGGEALRWTSLTAASLILTLPYARPERVGIGDAQDYAEHLADFLDQTQKGVFPVLVGQSSYAFNGAFNPLRTAPYFEYVGGALHLLTLGMLGPYALQNLMIVLSLLAAGFCSYLCLLRLWPSRPWPCLLLALLAISSPGVLALAYGGDMVPSWLTLPYLPVCAYLLGRVAEEGITMRRLAILAVAMAAIWLAHAPIAMWLSLVALPVIAVRLVVSFRKSGKADLAALAVSGVVFAALAGYVFVSVAELRLPTPYALTRVFHDGTVLELLRQGWQGFLRPVSAGAANLTSDLQLSPGLWLCVLVSAFGWRRAGTGARALLIAILGFTALLAPVHAVAGQLWPRIPAVVQRITDLWPMQRFYPIMSVFAPFAFVMAWRRRRPVGLLAREVAMYLLIAACLWSGLEAKKFLGRGFQVALSAKDSRRLILRRNVVLSVYSSAMQGRLSRYYSSGTQSPEMQLHLLDPVTLKVTRDNTDALLRSPGRAPALLGFISTDYGAELQQPLELPPGRYVLQFSFKDPMSHGTLRLLGSRSVQREYPLPNSGSERAFGSGPGQTSDLTLLIAGNAPEIIRVQFFNTTGRMITDWFADLRVIPYASSALPLRLTSLIPYRVDINRGLGGWLETTRIFVPGYRATVNGREAELKTSPDGLVMVRVPPGHAEMELRYLGPPLLRVAFWTSLGSWLSLPFFWMAARRWIRRRQSEQELNALLALYRKHWGWRRKVPLERIQFPSLR
jgi:hypothetical protein